MTSFRCKTCRYTLLDSPDLIIDSHSNPLNLNITLNCNSKEETLWYLNHEQIPWIKLLLDKSGWTKGKINCPNCNFRIGSYDFTSCFKCSCGSHITPSVHFVKSKIDKIENKILINK